MKDQLQVDTGYHDFVDPPEFPWEILLIAAAAFIIIYYMDPITNFMQKVLFKGN